MSFSPIHSRSPGRRGPSPAGAEDDRSNINTIFVGNLAPDSDERSLREFFGKYGYVTQVKVGCATFPVEVHMSDTLLCSTAVIYSSPCAPNGPILLVKLCRAGGHGPRNGQA